MKIEYCFSIWNKEQWQYIRYPHNWLSINRYIKGQNFLVITVTGFVFIIKKV